MTPTDPHSDGGQAAGLAPPLPLPPRRVRRRRGRWLLGRIPILVQLLWLAGVGLLLLTLWHVGSYWVIARFGETAEGEVTSRSPADAPAPAERRIEFRYRVKGA